MAYYPDSPDRANEESRDALDNIQSNFQHLEEIADNIPEIVDGSIVDDNLDDDNPSNGYFYKLECGLMVCFDRIKITKVSDDTLKGTFDFPASFSSIPYVTGFMEYDGGNTAPNATELKFPNYEKLKTSSVDILLKSDGPSFDSDDYVTPSVAVMGLW